MTLQFTDLFTRSTFFPLFGKPLIELNTISLDLSDTNLELGKIDLENTIDFDKYISFCLKSKNKEFGVGGYLEKREIYHRSPVFSLGPKLFRNIHLGVDIWCQPNVPIYAPTDAIVHSYRNNVGFGNFGPTIILEHNIGSFSFYTLYGHLKESDLKELYKRKEISKGEPFCSIGGMEENGSWPSHLHFQIICDLKGQEGDFPGVCSENEKIEFKKNCLNPNLILNCPLLA